MVEELTDTQPEQPQPDPVQRLRKRKQSKTISDELQRLIVLTTGAALVVVLLGLVPLWLISLRKDHLDDLTILAKFLASSSRAAIAFEDTESSNRLLESLSVHPRVKTATILNKNDETLAQYTRARSIHSSSSHSWLLLSLPEIPITASVPVYVDREFVGTVSIYSDGRDAYVSAFSFCIVLSILIILSYLLSLYVARRLQRRIVSPLTGLVSVIEKVSDNKDYSLRATNSDGSREVEALVDGFNQMILEIGLQTESLHRERERAEEALEVKSEFLRNMSHELRTPLNGIIGMNELVLGTNLNSEQHELLTIVQDSSYSLLYLVNDILHFSALESGNITLRPTNCDIHALIDHFIKSVELKAHRKEVRLEYEIAADVPHFLLLDQGRLRQIMLNLVHNAIKFTPAGGEIKLHVELLSSDGYEHLLKISVSDTGIGLPANKLNAVFQDFYQIDGSVSRSEEGLGLGLAICKHLVTLMGGEIEVTSKLGLGSTFTFTMAVLSVSGEVPDDIFDLHPERRPAEAKPSSSSEELKALVVDDHNASLMLHEKLLNRLNISVKTARGGHEALQLFHEQKFDLILLDCRMPGLDGFETIKEIRRIEAEQNLPRTPVIAVPAYAFESDKAICLESGMDGFISKPVIPDRLKEELTRLIKLPSTEDLPDIGLLN